jgi:hypothetical protein
MAPNRVTRDGEFQGANYVLYILNVQDQHGAKRCDVGAHFGPEGGDYRSGNYWPTEDGGVNMFASEPLLHAIIRALRAGLIS